MTNLFCLFPAHKNMFGEPGKGVHGKRIFGLARADVMATIGAAILYTLIIKRPPNNISFLTSTIKHTAILWFMGTVLHLLFCVETPITRALVSRKRY